MAYSVGFPFFVSFFLMHFGSPFSVSLSPFQSISIKRPGDLDLGLFDLYMGLQVIRVMGFLPPKLQLPTPFRSRPVCGLLPQYNEHRMLFNTWSHAGLCGGGHNRLIITVFVPVPLR